MRKFAVWLALVGTVCVRAQTPAPPKILLQYEGTGTQQRQRPQCIYPGVALSAGSHVATIVDGPNTISTTVIVVPIPNKNLEHVFVVYSPSSPYLCPQITITP